MGAANQLREDGPDRGTAPRGHCRIRALPILASTALVFLVLLGGASTVLTSDQASLGEHSLADVEMFLQPGSPADAGKGIPMLLAQVDPGTHGATATPGVQAPAAPHSQDTTPPESRPSSGGEHAAPPTPGKTLMPQEEGLDLAAPVHEAGKEAHGPALPQISPIPGVTLVETMIDILDYELHGRALGWRPNDLIIGQFTDNVNCYQLGVLEALRFTALRLKDSLARMGDADTYDPDLEQAVNLLMNRATLFWFPSAETSYDEALDHLRNFVEKLKTGKRTIYYRKDNLVSLFSAYKDLLGNVNKTLIVSPISWFKTDDYYYYAKGVAHVYYEIIRVVRVGSKVPLSTVLFGLEAVDEIIHELHRVEQMDPWIILDSELDGFMANHRANINAPLSEVTHLMGLLAQWQ